MSKKFWIIIAIICLMLGLYFLEIFPDPYHKEGRVNVYVWIYREIDELLHGEKG